VLTMFQLLFDLMIATTSPMGYGHVYAPEHYIDAWIAVAGLTVDPGEVAALKTRFAQAAAQGGND